MVCSEQGHLLRLNALPMHFPSNLWSLWHNGGGPESPHLFLLETKFPGSGDGYIKAGEAFEDLLTLQIS